MDGQYGIKGGYWIVVLLRYGDEEERCDLHDPWGRVMLYARVNGLLSSIEYSPVFLLRESEPSFFPDGVHSPLIIQQLHPPASDKLREDIMAKEPSESEKRKHHCARKARERSD